MSEEHKVSCFTSTSLDFDHALCYQYQSQDIMDFAGGNIASPPTQIQAKYVNVNKDVNNNPFFDKKCMKVAANVDTAENITSDVWLCADFDDERAIAAHVMSASDHNMPMRNSFVPPPDTSSTVTSVDTP